MALTLTKQEFDEFWDDVLGDAWAIDELETDRGSEIGEDWMPGEVFTIEYLALMWQGDGFPEPTQWISRHQLENGPNFIALFRAWKKRQTIVTLSFSVPVDRVEEIVATVTERGGKRIV